MGFAHPMLSIVPGEAQGRAVGDARTELGGLSALCFPTQGPSASHASRDSPVLSQGWAPSILPTLPPWPGMGWAPAFAVLGQAPQALGSDTW